MTDLPSIYELRIQRWTPKTIPLPRLARYLDLLAALIGHPDHVFWQGLTKGSTRPAVRVERGYRVQVRDRLALVGTPDAPKDLADAEREVNVALRTDETHAVLVERLSSKRSAKIIEFPGAREKLPTVARVSEPTEIDGEVVGVTGIDDTISVRIRLSNGGAISCTTRNRDIARSLAAKLWMGKVRVFGRGSWVRTEGRWTLEQLKIDHFDPLEVASLKQDVDRLRAIESNPWAEDEDPIATALAIRRDG